MPLSLIAETAPDLGAWEKELYAASTSYDVFRVLRRISNAFGYFGFFVLKALEPGARKLAPSVILNSLNPDFLRAFDDLQMLTQTNILHRIGSSLEPAIASRSRLPVEVYGDKAAAMAELLDDFEIGSCLFIPVHSRDGKKGIVGFAATQDNPDVSEILRLQHLAVLAHDRLVALAAPERSDQVALTERERECLTWTAAGKTSVEISAILGISPHTVDHYLTTAGQKLDTVNRAHTVATALRRGLIS